MEKKLSPRLWYALSFVIILTLEVLIALFVNDAFIRPYGGDILVTVLICCFVRMIFTSGIKLLPLWVFLFSAAVEVLQYFDFVSLLGLQNITFFRILLGSTFSFVDLLCYAVGCVLFLLCETALCHKSSKKGVK